MQLRFFLTTSAIAILITPALARGELIMSLSMPDSTIAPGESTTVSVTLSGLMASQELDALGTTVVFDGSLLGTPVITPGPIMPNPLDDPLDVLSTANSGLADVAFLTFGSDSADHITTNGIFYSFEVTGVTPGSGQLSIDFASATKFNSAEPFNPLPLNVTPGPSVGFVVTPEPSSLGLVALGCVLAAARRFTRSRRRTMKS